MILFGYWSNRLHWCCTDPCTSDVAILVEVSPSGPRGPTLNRSYSLEAICIHQSQSQEQCLSLRKPLSSWIQRYDVWRYSFWKVFDYWLAGFRHFGCPVSGFCSFCPQSCWSEEFNPDLWLVPRVVLSSMLLTFLHISMRWHWLTCAPVLPWHRHNIKCFLQTRA